MGEHDILIFRAVLDGGFFALYAFWSIVGARLLFRFGPDILALIKELGLKGIGAVTSLAAELAKLSEKIDAMKKGPPPT